MGMLLGIGSTRSNYLGAWASLDRPQMLITGIIYKIGETLPKPRSFFRRMLVVVANRGVFDGKSGIGLKKT